MDPVQLRFLCCCLYKVKYQLQWKSLGAKQLWKARMGVIRGIRKAIHRNYLWVETRRWWGSSSVWDRWKVEGSCHSGWLCWMSLGDRCRAGTGCCWCQMLVVEKVNQAVQTRWKFSCRYIKKKKHTSVCKYINKIHIKYAIWKPKCKPKTYWKWWN